MKRPSFQFYPADWRNNANLRRCSDAARGAWMDILCVLHDSDEYGAARWPLAELARAAGVALKLAKELAEKLVLKGADAGPVTFVHRPRHAGKEGDPVTLIEGYGPIWFSSRMVLDEWRRKVSGGGTRFGTTKPDTKPRHGDDLGDGATSSSSPSVSTKEANASLGKPARAKSRCSLPKVFPLQPDLDWAKSHWLGKGRVDLCNGISEEIEKFRDHHTSRATMSADWSGSWRTWVRNAMKFNNGGHNGRAAARPNAHASFIEGAFLASSEPEPGVETGGSGDLGEAGLALLAPGLRRAAG